MTRFNVKNFEFVIDMLRRVYWNIKYSIFKNFAGFFSETKSIPCRSCHSDLFCQKGVLKNFAKFTGKHLCQSLLSNKVADLRTAALLNKRLWNSCFPGIL